MRQQRNILSKHFHDCPIEPSIDAASWQASHRYRFDRPQSAVVIAIVWKQALRVNGQFRTTVVSVANKSVAFDFSSHSYADEMREETVARCRATTTVSVE